MHGCYVSSLRRLLAAPCPWIQQSQAGMGLRHSERSQKETKQEVSNDL